MPRRRSLCASPAAVTGCNKIKYCQPFDAIWSISCGDKVAEASQQRRWVFFLLLRLLLAVVNRKSKWFHKICRMSSHASMRGIIRTYSRRAQTRAHAWNNFLIFSYAAASPTSNTFFSFHFGFLSHSFDGWMFPTAVNMVVCVGVWMCACSGSSHAKRTVRISVTSSSSTHFIIHILKWITEREQASK